MKITLITAYYNINSKQPTDFYLKNANNFLSTVETPIVLFTSSEYVKTFKEMRKNFPIIIIERPFEDLYAWTHYKNKWIEDNKNDPEKYIGHSPELYAIWSQKIFFVDEIIDKNPFKTEFFFWCDIGAFREPKHLPLLRKFPQRTEYFLEDKIIFSSVERLDKRFIINYKGINIDTSNCPRIVGGLWGGSISACKKWKNAYVDMLSQYINNKIFAGKDQHVMLSAILHDSALSTIIMPDPRYNHDKWFYLEYLLSGIIFEYKKDMSYYDY